MNQIVLGSLICLMVRGESEIAADDDGMLHGIAAEIGSSPTILKIFVKGDIQEGDIEKLFGLPPKGGEKLENDAPQLKRNRRNPITDYIGRLYSFNRLLRPYREQNTDGSTRLPWLKKILGGARKEPQTESFWGMALGAHTFKPSVRPLARAKVPYHRIRDQQRIDKLLGITRTNPTTVVDFQTKPLQWIKNQKKYDKYVLQARSHEKTTASEDLQSATSRNAFHRAPFDVVGLRTMNFSHLRVVTTPKRIKFCEKPCANEKDDSETRKPRINPDEPQLQTPPGDEAEDSSTGECSCTPEEESCDCTEDEDEPESDCLNMVVKGKPKATTKRIEKLKTTTFKFTRPKEEKKTGPIWTLPPNPILDKARTDEKTEQRYTTKGTTKDKAFATTSKPGNSAQRTKPGYRPQPKPRCTCRKPKPSEICMLQCPHLLIPTRVQNIVCSTTKRPKMCCTAQCSTRCTPQSSMCCNTEPSTCSQSTTCSTQCTTSRCQSKPPKDIPVSVVEMVDQNMCPDRDKGKPQKIVVRISSALEEVPVVIMRDDGVSGVSLTLVNDYILDENNRLIKCSGRKTVGQHTRRKGSRRPQTKVCKGSKHFIPQLIRHHLYGLQPKPYSFKLLTKPEGKLRHGSKKSVLPFNDNAYRESNRLPGIPILNPLAYKINSPNSPRMDGFGVPMDGFPADPYPRQYGSYKISNQPIGRLNQPGSQADDLPGPTNYARFKINQDKTNGLGPPRFEPQRFNWQNAFNQRSDSSQLLGYRSPFFPIFYPSKNYDPAPKYIIPGLQ